MLWYWLCDYVNGCFCWWFCMLMQISNDVCEALQAQPWRFYWDFIYILHRNRLYLSKSLISSISGIKNGVCYSISCNKNGKLFSNKNSKKLRNSLDCANNAIELLVSQFKFVSKFRWYISKKIEVFFVTNLMSKRLTYGLSARESFCPMFTCCNCWKLFSPTRK